MPEPTPIWAAQVKRVYQEMLVKYRDFVQQESKLGRGASADMIEKQADELKTAAVVKARKIVKQIIKDIPEKDLPLFINENWGFADCKKLFQTRLSGRAS
jgi:hypothetical protein